MKRCNLSASFARSVRKGTIARLLTITALLVSLGACANVKVRVRLPDGVQASVEGQPPQQVPQQESVELQLSSSVWPIRVFMARRKTISVEVPTDCMVNLGLSKGEAAEAVQMGHNSLLIDVWVTSEGREWGAHDCLIDISRSRLARAVLDGFSCEMTPVSMPFATAQIRHASVRR